jgi:hypothetical protein
MGRIESYDDDQRACAVDYIETARDLNVSRETSGR